MSNVSNRNRESEHSSKSDRQQAETNEAILAAIVDSSDDAIISKSLDGYITTWNLSAERIFGYLAAEVIGRNISILIPVDRLEEEPAILSRLRIGERVDHFETQRVRKDGTRISVSLTISPIKDSTGRIVGVSKIARDITEKKRLDNALQQAKEAAENSDRAKDRFIAVLSHELRTPLTPVLIAVQMLESDTTISEDQRELLGTIHRNIDLEARLIDDLLDLTRISKGKLEMHFTEVHLHKRLMNVIEICDSDIRSKRLKLTLDLRAETHHVQADSARLQQILWNLLKNATKFTPVGGEIVVRTSNPRPDLVSLVVEDTGIGIDSAMLPRIFDAFEQGGKSINQEFGGLGLGLSISAGLVQMLGGTLTAASQGRGKGAAFTLELSASCATETTGKPSSEQNPDQSPKKGCFILLVEDHSDTAVLMARLLRRRGYDVKVAGTVADALRAIDAEPFDLLISDIGLPDGSGLDLMKQIHSRKSLKGIVLSGFGMEEDLLRSKAAGFVAHLTKPIDVSRLEKVIDDLCACE